MKRRYILPSFALLALVVMVALWIDQSRRPSIPNVIFLTVESWRAESVTPERTPNLLQAAESGTHFLAHRAVAAWTAPNIIAILTGIAPVAQGVNARGQSIDAQADVFLEDLAAAGWTIAGLQSFMTIDVYRNLGLEVSPGQTLLPWLAGRARDGRPFALWYHYLDTHLPYAPPEARRGRFENLAGALDSAARERLAVVETAPAIPAGTVEFEQADAPAIRALYDGGVAAFDDWFGAFWDFFNRSGLRDNTILVVTADHGEELLERGNVGHASTTRDGNLHEEVLRIPLFVWLPEPMRSATVPQRIEAPTAHTDIVPALLELLGRAGGGGSAMLFGPPADRGLRAATSFGGYAEPDPAAPSGFEVALLEGAWKLRLRQAAAAAAVPSLYDLAADPDERDNMAAREPERTRQMAQRLLPDLMALWSVPARSIPSMPDGAVSRPEWLLPLASGVVSYTDIADGARLKWTGDPQDRYLLEYQAGTGALTMVGTLEVAGTMKDFGTIGEDYWQTWVLPYERVRLRVYPAGRADLASEWLELEFAR